MNQEKRKKNKSILQNKDVLELYVTKKVKSNCTRLSRKAFTNVVIRMYFKGSLKDHLSESSMAQKEIM